MKQILAKRVADARGRFGPEAVIVAATTGQFGHDDAIFARKGKLSSIWSPMIFGNCKKQRETSSSS